MQDGSLEADALGDGGVDVKRVVVARETVELSLELAGLDGLDKVGCAVGLGEVARRRARSACQSRESNSKKHLARVIKKRKEAS